MAIFRTLSRQRDLLRLFEEAGSNALRAVELLDEMMQTWPDQRELAREILLCEQEGDRLTHAVIRRVNEGSTRPFERTDTLALASTVDDVVDYAEEIADLLGLYKIEAPMEQAQRLTKILTEATRSMCEALAHLDESPTLDDWIVEVNRIEEEGDRVFRDAVASVFAGGIDPILIIRWKDLFERLEAAIDRCEHAVIIMAGIAVKAR